MAGRGWVLVVGAFALAWAPTLASTVDGGPDGGFYPATIYPMFSGVAPTVSVQYVVQADGNASLRIPLAFAFDETEVVRQTLVPPTGRLLVRAADCAAFGTKPCTTDLDPVVERMRPVLQARLGLARPPEHLQLVVVTRDLVEPALVSEVQHALA